MFEELARPYILHRYMVVLDKTFWNKFNASCKQSMLVLDNSKNIKLVPKASHFSGRQHSLHCTVLQQPDHIYLFNIGYSVETMCRNYVQQMKKLKYIHVSNLNQLT